MWSSKEPITPAATAAAPPAVYNQEAHPCGMPSRRSVDKRGTGTCTCGQRICKACSALTRLLSSGRDTNSHGPIRSLPHRALLEFALPVNVDLASPRSALGVWHTVRLLVQL